MQVLDLSSGGEHSRATGFGRVQISTFCVGQGLLAVGGFTGELIIADVHTGRLLSRCCFLPRCLAAQPASGAQQGSCRTLPPRVQLV